MTGQQKQQAPPHSRSSEGAQTGPEASPSISVATILLSQRLLFCYSLIISSPCFLSRFFLTLKVKVRYYILFKVFYLFVLTSIYVFYFYFQEIFSTLTYYSLLKSFFCLTFCISQNSFLLLLHLYRSWFMTALSYRFGDNI